MRTRNNQSGFGHVSELLILIAVLAVLSAIAAPIAKALGYHPGVGVLVVLGIYAVYFIYLQIQDYLYFKALRNGDQEPLPVRPDLHVSMNDRGAAAQGKDQLEAAIARCREALRQNPEDPDAHYNLGIALSHDDQLDTAIASYRKALELNPVHADAYFRLGLALGRVGQLDDAIASFRKALQIKPDLVDARCVLGVMLQQKGEQESAQSEIHEVERLHPK